MAQDFVFLGCHKVVSDHRALSLGRASSVLSISLVFISGMRLEKGIATSTMSRMGFLFVLYCLLPGFCQWIMEKDREVINPCSSFPCGMLWVFRLFLNTSSPLLGWLFSVVISFTLCFRASPGSHSKALLGNNFLSWFISQ